MMEPMAAIVAGAAAEAGTAARFGRWVAAVSVVPWVAALVAVACGLEVELWPVLGVVASMHVGTTAAVYVDREFRPLLAHDPVRYLAAPVLLIAAGVAAAWWLPPPLFAVLVAGRVLWQIHHFNRQNLGMISMWLKATRRPGLSEIERRVLEVTGWGAIVGVLATATDWLPAVDVLVDVLRPVLIATGLGLLAYAGWLVARTGRWVTGLAVVYWLPVFLVRPAVALLAIGATHAAQYYLMMFGLSGGRDRLGAVSTVAAVIAGAVTVGLFHANAAPFAHDTTSGVGYGLFFGVGAAHFVIDAGMWKMRDPAQRGYLKARFSFL